MHVKYSQKKKYLYVQSFVRVKNLREGGYAREKNYSRGNICP